MDITSKLTRLAPDTRSLRALWISLSIAVSTAAGLLAFQFSGTGFEGFGILNIRFFAGLVALAAVAGMQLSRRGHGNAGISLIHAALQIAILFVAAVVSRLGPAAAVLALIISLALTSVLFKTRWTAVDFAAGIVVAVTAFTLDYVYLYPRIPFTAQGWITAVTPLLAVLFMALVVRHARLHPLPAKKLFILPALRHAHPTRNA
jgi:hypothetical protein